MKRILLISMVLLAYSGLSIAQSAGKYGDWTVKRAQGVSNASTTNSSGSSIGFLCVGGSEMCGPYLALSVDCEETATYPTMINSPVGAFHATTTCAIIAGRKYHLINEVEIFNQAIESGGEIGFAFPLQNGKFQVARFSTIGAITAIKDALSFPQDKEASPSTQKDQSL